MSDDLAKTVAELERLLADASGPPGEWEYDPEDGAIDCLGGGIAIMHPHASMHTIINTGEHHCSADARLIVAAVNALPILLAALKRRPEDAEVALNDVKLLERHLQDTRDNYVRDWTELSTENTRLRADAEVGELLRRAKEQLGGFLVHWQDDGSVMVNSFLKDGREATKVHTGEVVDALRQLLGVSDG